MIEYRPSDDTLYVNISGTEASVLRIEALDDRRTVHYSEDGCVIAVHFAGVSGGIEMAGLPEHRRILDAMQNLRAVLRNIGGDPAEQPSRSGRIGAPWSDPPPGP